MDPLNGIRTAVARQRYRWPESADQAGQQALGLQLRQLAATSPSSLPSLDEVYLRCYSQNGEDGALLFLFSILGTASRRAIEICAGDGVQCNAANLVVNHGWDALLIDGDAELISRGKWFYSQCLDTVSCPPVLAAQWITAENVNTVIEAHGFGGEIDLLSLDLDGVDYWIWKALDTVNPRVVVVEYQDILGPDVALTVPYKPSFGADRAPGDFDYQGASLGAFVKLGVEKGYRLVGVEHLGFNAFFVRDDLGRELLPSVDQQSC